MKGEIEIKDEYHQVPDYYTLSTSHPVLERVSSYYIRISAIVIVQHCKNYILFQRRSITVTNKHFPMIIPHSTDNTIFVIYVVKCAIQLCYLTSFLSFQKWTHRKCMKCYYTRMIKHNYCELFQLYNKN